MTEVWKDINGYEGLYQVSSLGRVRSMERKVSRLKNGKQTLVTFHGRILVPKDNGNGYLCVGLYKDNKPFYVTIHRLVANAFIENPLNLPEINHKDEDKSNNSVFVNADGTVDIEKSNLEWCSSSYNKRYGAHRKRCQETKNKRGVLGAEVQVVQLSLDGKYIDTFKSSHEAARINGIKLQGNIINCCKHRCAYSYGYKWMYLSEYEKQL